MTKKYKSIPEAFFKQAESQSEKVLYSRFLPAGNKAYSWQKTPDLQQTSLGQVARRVKSVASMLKSIGVKKGDKVAIISNTRPEWLEADLAILSLGAIVVSVYPSLLENEMAYILWDSGTKFVFAENQEQLNKLEKISRTEILMSGCADRQASLQKVEIEAVVSFEEAAAGSLRVISFNDCIKASPEGFEIESSIGLDDLASIVYTSGTTGAPKGVLQSHGNHLANVRQAETGSLYRADSSIYMMLPLAHSFAKLMGYIGFLQAVELQFPSVSDSKSSKVNQRQALLELSMSSCAIYPLVPRILEKLKDGIEAKSEKAGLGSRLLKLTLKAAKDKKSFLHALTTPVRRSIRKKLFGKNFQYVVSGGAKLPVDVNNFFAGIEIEILEGYGLTETCVATNCNRPGHNRIGTVGPVLSDDINLKIADDGEILFSGPNIALGYHQKPNATAASWDSNGWFHTGDLGEIDSEGCLKITGRKKEIIVTAGGKKVVPEKIEADLKSSSIVSQAVLVGEGKPYCMALVTINQEGAAGKNSSEIKEILQSHLEQVNSGLASFETVKRLVVLKEEFSLDNGYLTPTLKVKRIKVIEAYTGQIEEAYRSAEKIIMS